jgi:hypothetical protein
MDGSRCAKRDSVGGTMKIRWNWRYEEGFWRRYNEVGMEMRYQKGCSWRYHGNGCKQRCEEGCS